MPTLVGDSLMTLRKQSGTIPAGNGLILESIRILSLSSVSLSQSTYKRLMISLLDPPIQGLYLGVLIKRFVNAEYYGSGIREYILNRDVEQKDDFVVHHIVNFLSKDFETFVVNYNISIDKWTIQKRISMYVQEEERIKAQKTHNAGSVYHVKSD
ncbi:hypothetical protein U9M48_024721 [Paspalum notatum var. saurae]|uniref:Uncharacterized protein n=1 Tax=Paspalum notatum var. saurae TaxID=547442 RepID=A0AAQ3TNX4_PASNO